MIKLIYFLIFLTFGSLYAQSNIKVNEKAPKINITDWIKNMPEDKNLNNKYIVLEFWATWCGPCIAAVPHLNQLQDEFKQNDLYFISITDESIAKVERTLKRIEFKSIVATDLTKNTQINFGDGTNGLETYPLTVLIDKNGIIKWIGEPKNLNSTVMSEFLNIDSTLHVNNTSETENQGMDYLDLMTNNKIKTYFNIQESKYNQPSSQSIQLKGFKTIELKFASLLDIYSEIFNIKNNDLKIPETIRNKHFDLLYKNKDEPNSLNLLEIELLKKLNLKKQTDFKTQKNIFVSIKNAALLEKNLDGFSARSEADDKIIFTGYTINKMLDELSKYSTEIFSFIDKNNTQYDFIINIKSKKDIIDSLKSFGLIITEEKDIKTKIINLIEE